MENLTNRSSKAFCCIRELFKNNMISEEERGYLKNLVFLEDSGLIEALLVYEHNKDPQELKGNILDLVPEKAFSKFILRIDTHTYSNSTRATTEENSSPFSTGSWTPLSKLEDSLSPTRRLLKRPASLNVPLNRQMSYYQQCRTFSKEDITSPFADK